MNSNAAKKLPDSSSGPKGRQKARYSAQLKVEIFLKGLEHHHIDKTANISETGLFLCTELPSEIGDKMHLRIILSDRAAFFDVKAQVVWLCDGNGSHPRGIGLEFVELNRVQSEVIEKILREYVNVQN